MAVKDSADDIARPNRILEGVKEALAVARGEQPAARITIGGHKYVPATQLDSLLKEREELTDRNEQLQRTLLSEQKLSYGLSVELRQFRDRASQAEQERDALQARVKELEGDFAKLTDMAKESEDLRGKALHAAEQWQDRATRLQQERDEAIAALNAILSANDDFRAGLPQDWEGDPLQDACEAARDLVRRLAASPENELNNEQC
ncbi:hypothetical protein [Nitrobacter sp. TKz-YC02]|uniref:hypothetical protein n=1 Tax=Nitrobacter sp. TKz-YC02 TaxID=3398704 RepID=UPI003CF186AA